MQTSTSKTIRSAAAAITAMAAVGYAMALSGPAPAAGTRAVGTRTISVAAGGTRAPGAGPPAQRAGRPSRPAPPPGRKVAARRPAPRRGRPGPARPQPLVRREIGGPRLASRGIVVASRAMPLPAVPASAYVIANAATGQVLAAKDAHGLYPPASTLKVLTAITMLPRLRQNATIKATPAAASVVPNIIGLIPGHRYKVADLFRALLLISANDAAVSLVQGSGSFSKGMALMNVEAHRLQAYDVVARQPNGLPAPGQVVSAYDLALIARRALAMPLFMRYDRTLSATFSATRFGRVPMVNENGLLTQYPGAIGGKIGWTMAAGATYVGMARRNGVTLIVTILHATPLTEIASAEQLLSWGFAMNGRVRPVGTLVRPLPGP